MRVPLISVCMIVKNEAANIANAIESSRVLDPEYIVVDTGSTDGTQDILRGLGIEPLVYEWADSFADARNFALSKATASWVLSLDGDEVLTQKDLLGMCYANSMAVGYQIEKRSYVNDKLLLGYRPCRGEHPALESGFSGYLSEPNTLLFRNKPGMVWKGAIHETVGQSMDENGWYTLHDTSLTVLHNYGRHSMGAGKSEFFAKLSAKRLEEDGSDPIAMYYAALDRLAHNDLASAEELFTRSLSISRRDFTVFGLAKTQLGLGKLSLAEQGFVDFLRIRPQELTAWAGLLTATLLRKDQDRLDYYVKWAEKAGMGTGDVYLLAAYVSNKLGNTSIGRYYIGKAEDVQRISGKDSVPAGAYKVR